MDLTVEQLCKTYNKKEALKAVSFTLTTGIYGLLGPNGAGKSTLMNILTGNLRQSSGTVLWNGQDISRLGKKYRTVLGYVTQEHALYPEFTAMRFLYYMAALKGMKTEEARSKVPYVLEIVGLSDVSGKKIKTFSGGMKQRLMIAQSILGAPDLLIMDEPTVGLDPRQRDSIRKLIVEIASEKIVLLSTHVVSDIEWISSEILLLKDGTLIRKGSRDALIAEIKNEETVENIRPAGKEPGLEDVYLYFFGERYEEDNLL